MAAEIYYLPSYLTYLVNRMLSEDEDENENEDSNGYTCLPTYGYDHDTNGSWGNSPLKPPSTSFHSAECGAPIERPKTILRLAVDNSPPKPIGGVKILCLYVLVFLFVLLAVAAMLKPQLFQSLNPNTIIVFSLSCGLITYSRIVLHSNAPR